MKTSGKTPENGPGDGEELGKVLAFLPKDPDGRRRKRPIRGSGSSFLEGPDFRNRKHQNTDQPSAESAQPALKIVSDAKVQAGRVMRKVGAPTHVQPRWTTSLDAESPTHDADETTAIGLLRISEDDGRSSPSTNWAMIEKVPDDGDYRKMTFPPLKLVAPPRWKRALSKFTFPFVLLRSLIKPSHSKR